MSKAGKITIFIVLSVIFFAIGMTLKSAGFLMGIPLVAVAIMALHGVIFKKTKKRSTEIKLNKDGNHKILKK